MSIVYINGELSHIRFIDHEPAHVQDGWYAVGTHIVFAKDESAAPVGIPIAIAG